MTQATLPGMPKLLLLGPYDVPFWQMPVDQQMAALEAAGRFAEEHGARKRAYPGRGWERSNLKPRRFRAVTVEDGVITVH